MTHQELVKAVAFATGQTQTVVTKTLEAVVSATYTTMKKGGSVRVAGLGLFVVRKQAARVIRNPRTGALLHVRAKRKPGFYAAAAFERAFG